MLALLTSALRSPLREYGNRGYNSKETQRHKLREI